MKDELARTSSGLGVRLRGLTLAAAGEGERDRCLRGDVAATGAGCGDLERARRLRAFVFSLLSSRPTTSTSSLSSVTEIRARTRFGDVVVRRFHSMPSSVRRCASKHLPSAPVASLTS